MCDNTMSLSKGGSLLRGDVGCGRGLHTGRKGVSGYCYHCWVLAAIFMGSVDVCLEKKGKFWGEPGAWYLPSGSNKVKVWKQWTGLLVDYWSWVLILGGACVEICRGWAHWESRGKCIGSCGRKMTVREPPWEQSGLPSMWLISGKLLRLNLIAQGEYLTSQLSSVAAWLLVTYVCAVCLVGELVLVFYGLSSMRSWCNFKEWVWNSRSKLYCIAWGEWKASRVSLQECDVRYTIF